ncbi:potassium transporter Trk [Aerococcus urinaehominis]|uniref:Potassium transporter Trk n=1 Tax=Aerococcus urinaehominis TaxID=128944 RepID=A0A0X8FLK5_9LACT|nr:TrkA family potassium uptake protein [Aerococcus urinaehominis]AMB99319.1 potassium transporter Trk [Aerococcus urinaehominis]SDM20162.1 trk system potassium uptake protein TrkA [Aerococcus urinaehominis]
MKKQRVVGILGLGLFGSALARGLSDHGVDVVGCDKNEDHVEDLEEYLTIGSVGNFTDLDFMRQAGFASCDVIVIGTGENLESSVLGVVNAQELGVKQIICKAKNQQSAKALTALGVSRVILPEEESGTHLANVLSRQSLEGLINLDDSTAVVEFKVPKEWLGKKLSDLDLRRRYDLNIIGIRKHPKQALDTQLDPNQQFEADDFVVAVANLQTFERVDYLERI